MTNNVIINFKLFISVIITQLIRTFEDDMNFAYIKVKFQVNGDRQFTFSICTGMRLYNNCKWKGKELRIQVAKDNFIQRSV
jgi:hypothetical protein